MNLRPALLLPLLLCALPAFAQSTGDTTRTTTFQTPRGELQVNTGQPAPRDFGPPPPFEQLDRRGAGWLSADDAVAYPPLANDFIHADGNRDGRVSKAEYERWARAR